MQGYLLDYFIPWGWCISSDLWTKYLEYSKKGQIKFQDKVTNRIASICRKKLNKTIWSKKFIEFNLMLRKKIIFPNKSLIKNIGFDGSGVNSSVTDKFNTTYKKLNLIKSKIIFKNDKNMQKKQTKILMKSVKYFF